MADGFDRTCRKCGTSWHILSDDVSAIKRNDRRKMGAALWEFGYGGSRIAAAEVERSRIEARLEQGRRCPECGATDYDQVATKVTNDRDTDQAARLKQYIRDQKSQGRKVTWLQANEELNQLDKAAAEAIPNPTGSPALDTRTCPYCAEEIKAAAVKCKHCGSAVEPVSMPDNQESAENELPAAWYPDPEERHELRYWDGRSWTTHVSDAGITSQDPPQ